MSVDRFDRDCVTAPALEPAEHVPSLRRLRPAPAVQVNAVAGNAQLGGRGRPGDSDARAGAAFDPEGRWRARWMHEARRDLGDRADGDGAARGCRGTDASLPTVEDGATVRNRGERQRGSVVVLRPTARAAVEFRPGDAAAPATPLAKPELDLDGRR